MFYDQKASEVSADVELHGPPLAGVAQVHAWFIDIPVYFGPSKCTSPKLDWERFHKLFNPAVDDGVEGRTVSVRKGRITTQHDTKIDLVTGDSAASQSARSVLVYGAR